MAKLDQKINVAFQEAFGRDATRGQLDYYNERGYQLLIDNLRKDPNAGGNFAEWRAKNKAPEGVDPDAWDRLPQDQKDLLNVQIDLANQAAEDSGIDTSQITEAEIQGFVDDANNALSSFFAGQREDIGEKYGLNREALQATFDQTIGGLAAGEERATEDFETQLKDFKLRRGRLEEDYTLAVEALGITDKRIQEDVVRNLADLAEDREVSLGNIDRAFVERLRSERDILEEQGLTFSGEAIRRIGEKAAVAGVEHEGLLQTGRRLGEETVERGFGRETGRQEAISGRSLEDLARGTNVAGLLRGRGFENIDLLQEAALTSKTRALGDIARARTAATTGLDISLRGISLAEKSALGTLTGQEAFEKRSLVQTEIGQLLGAGRTRGSFKLPSF